MNEVRKISAVVNVSREALEDGARLQSAMKTWINMTPAERAELAHKQAVDRAIERADAGHKDVTVGVLLDRLHWTRRYADHFVQPYCYCSDGSDGWEYCEHARDEGLAR